MLERGFVYNDMLTILRDGIIMDEPELRDGKWSYKIRFHKFNGNRDAACVVGIKNMEKLTVITVMWVDIGG